MSEQNQNPSPAMSAEEYQRGVATQQLEAGMAVAEEARNPMTGYARVIETDDGVLVRTSDMSSRDSYRGNDGFPQARASKVTRELSQVEGSGVDYDAARKVDELRDYADVVNHAYDIVQSDAQSVEPAFPESRRQQILTGDNGIGSPSFEGNQTTQKRGAMVRSGDRKYDIKNGVAMRGRTGNNSKVDTNGNMIFDGTTSDKKEGEYVPFEPQHQEAATKAMKSLAEKRMNAADKAKRDKAVKAAKKTLALSGTKIPKSQAQKPDSNTKQAA